jgi:two-component system, OmpR family, response regulator
MHFACEIQTPVGRGGMRKLQVLLVDDEIEFIATISERLSSRGIQARTATSGEEALVLIEAEPPDVIVLDVMLPGTLGTELLKLIKQEHPAIPVILLTGGDVSTRERMEGMRLGAFDYLLKPVSMEELVDKLRGAAGKVGTECGQ